MLRAFVLSIVLVFAAGPTVALLCCPSLAAPAAACQHQEPGTLKLVAGASTCSQAPLSVVAPPPEDVRRTRAARSVTHVIPVSRYQVAPSVTATSAWHAAWHEQRFEKRPLLTALRI